jgi:ABC-type amino acid transport substrate-binding protein
MDAPSVKVPPTQQAPPGGPTTARDLSQRVAKFLQENLTLAVVVGIFAIAGYLTDSYVGSLREQNNALDTELRTEKALYVSEVGALKQQISEILPASVNFPIPFDPANGASVVGGSVILQWSEKAPHPSYLVEVARLDPQNARVWKDSQIFPATDPSNMRTRFPLGSATVISPGTYLWRVAPGSKIGPHQELQGSWSGYYKFTAYGSVMDRIRDTNTLLVGVSYVQNSDFMSRDADGNASGFDADMIRFLTERLSSDKQLNLDGKGNFKDEFVNYPSIDQILFHGIEQGEVDVAIGSITKAKYRERRGIRFTQGYLESRLVLLGNPGSQGALLTVDQKVGAVKETSNFEALQYLQKKYHFQPFPADSYQDLLSKLRDHTVDYVIIDEPLAADVIATGSVIVAKDLVPDLGDYLQEKVGYDREEYAIAASDPTLHDKLDHLMKSAEMRKLIYSLKEKYKVETSSLGLTH